MKTTFEYWQAFAQKHASELEGLSPSELEEFSFVVMCAIDEELYHKYEISFRMVWGISTVEPSAKVLDLLTHNFGFHYVVGKSYSYFEWIRFLTMEG